MSIQADLSGLSFCIADHSSQQLIEVFENRIESPATPQLLLDHLEHAFNSNQCLQEAFSRVQLIHSNPMQTLVPAALFEESSLSDYLKYNAKIFQSDFVTYDVVKNEDLMVVYIPFVNLNNFIFDRFGSFEYKHSATILIDRILQLNKHTTEPKMYINIENHQFDLLVTQQNQLRLYNRFDYNTKEDFIYYLLFVAEQLNLNPEVFQCILMGTVNDNSDLFSIAYTYIRNVSILSDSNMPYSYKSSTEHFTLLSSLV